MIAFFNLFLLELRGLLVKSFHKVFPKKAPVMVPVLSVVREEED